MLGEKLRGQGLLVDRGVQEGKTAEGKALAAALKTDRLGGAIAQIHGHYLVALPADCPVKKWQTHARYLYTLQFRCRRLSFRRPSRLARSGTARRALGLRGLPIPRT